MQVLSTIIRNKSNNSMRLQVQGYVIEPAALQGRRSRFIMVRERCDR
jgi:hypothetical protein